MRVDAASGKGHDFLVSRRSTRDLLPTENGTTWKVLTNFILKIEKPGLRSGRGASIWARKSVELGLVSAPKLTMFDRKPGTSTFV